MAHEFGNGLLRCVPRDIQTAAVVDGDGTTIEHSGVIPRPVRSGMTAIRKAGGIVVLATGRTPWTISDKERKAFQTRVAAVTENGARTRVGDDVEVHSAMSPEEIRAVIGAIGKQRGHISYAIAFPEDTREQPIRWVLDEKDMTSLTSGRRGYAAVFTGNEQEIERLWIAQKPGLILVRPRRSVESELEFPQGINLLRSEHGACEISPIGISKRVAVEELLGMLDISPSLVLAVGNGVNDDHLEISEVSPLLVGENADAIAKFGDLPQLERVPTVRDVGPKLQKHALLSNNS